MAKAKKLPSGNWRVQAKAYGHTRSFTASTKTEAERQAAAWQLSAENENIGDTPEHLTFGIATDKYIEMKNNVLSPSTIRSYYNIRRNAFAGIENKKIKQLGNITIQTVINEYAASHSPKSVRNAYGLLTAVLKMYRPGFTPSVQLPQKKKVDIYIPTEEEIKKILSLSKDTPLETPLKLAIFGGLRAGEICALTPADINGSTVSVTKSIAYDSNNTWVIKSPKSYYGNRTIILPTHLELKAASDNKITMYNPNSLYKAYQLLLVKNKLPSHRFHDLRHFYISTLFDIGVPEKYIISQVGHSSSSITKRVYDHISAGRKNNYSEMISSHFETF